MRNAVGAVSPLLFVREGVSTMREERGPHHIRYVNV
jgi:hypothetical protein